MKPVTGFLAITFLLAIVIHGPGSAVAAAQELKREAIIEGAKKEGKVQIYGLLAVPEHWYALNPTVSGTNLMGIAARAPHPNAAMLYIDHMLSEEIQKDYLSGKFFKVSARQGIHSTVMQKLSKVKVIPVDIAQSENFEKNRKRFREIFLGGR